MRRSHRWLGAATLAAALLAAMVAGACTTVRRFTVRGRSMEPALIDGDRLLVLPGIVRIIRPRPGDLVLVRVPAVPGRDLIKRVATIQSSRGGTRYVVLGDNPAASTDSRHFGPISRAQITGRVWLRYWPDGRRGRVR